MSHELGEREKEVLRAVVQETISTGGPVGSPTLSRRKEFGLSPATLRNVLASLEAMGLVEKTHTSSGRIPTARGYRLYLDSLIQLLEPAPYEREIIQQGMSTNGRVEVIVQEASKILHSLTRHAGIALAPSPGNTLF